MEFSLEGTTQGCVFANAGACTVNLPAPERFAVHKLIVYGERPIRERTKATKDLLQAAVLVEWCMENGRQTELGVAWQDAIGRGRGWETAGAARSIRIDRKTATSQRLAACSVFRLWVMPNRRRIQRRG